MYSDPFNYALARLLQVNRPAPAALQAAVQQAFPALMPADYAGIRQQLDAAYGLAADLASAVNKQQLSQDEASQRLQQAFPQMAAANRASLLMQNLVDTR